MCPVLKDVRGAVGAGGREPDGCCPSCLVTDPPASGCLLWDGAHPLPPPPLPALMGATDGEAGDSAWGTGGTALGRWLPLNNTLTDTPGNVFSLVKKGHFVGF